MSTFGSNIKVSLFGESHGKGIGITIHNLPAGIELDIDDINHNLLLRRPKSNLSTPRQEQDGYEFISGFFNGKTTGSPLTVVIYNKDTRSRDYDFNTLRPSHADYAAYLKYGGFQDYRGGGHFSGRITAPIMILGSIAKQLLSKKGITIGSHILSIKDNQEESFINLEPTREMLDLLNSSDFPTIDGSKSEEFKQTILQAKENHDSVGGIVETCILGLEGGYGDPFFDSIESTLAHLLFSVPAVKGVSFGAGFDITRKFGSEANDPFIVENGSIKTSSNNSGGIQGGISNGMPILFKTGIKPTASIGKEQKTVNFETKEEVSLALQGRHDPCIVHRVIHVINAITAYGVLETITRKEGTSWMN